LSTGIESIEIVGGDLALDLVNTGSRRREGPFRDRLEGYGDLVTWAERVGLVTAEAGERLRAAAARDPAEAERVLERARALRETVYRVFAADARSEAPAPEDLLSLGESAAAAAARRVLVPDSSEESGGYRFAWPPGEELEQILWPVAMSAAELLVSDERERVKECATDNCNWLFLDMSRNRSRRWCDMKDCGNRAKARRHYARTRARDEHDH
jgi:predicted RNA-binding Zn ribbon-like protein